jgi:hypothetical protein
MHDGDIAIDVAIESAMGHVEKRSAQMANASLLWPTPLKPIVSTKGRRRMLALFLAILDRGQALVIVTMASKFSGIMPRR